MSEQNKHSWEYLFERYLSNSCTKEELEQFLQMVDQRPDAQELSALLKGFWNSGETGTSAPPVSLNFENMMAEAQSRVAPVISFPQQKKSNTRLMIAAAITTVSLLVAGYSYYKSERANPDLLRADKPEAAVKADIAPGNTGAVLTLANGEKIVLDSAANGQVAVQGISKIVKHNGQVTYKNEHPGTAGILFNTMSTPKGRQYQLTLSDGTKVWLNAASSITYPTTFSGKERKVIMTGEAYFEVAKNREMPFKVMANEAEVVVLGTHFNINAYSDEPAVQTTLFEGSVKLTAGANKTLLEPGQQALLSREGDLKLLRDADVELALAWKNGYTSFKSADIKTIMRQVERWYNVEVRYEGTIPERKFTGDVSRNANLSQLLRLLEVSKIHFTIAGNLLTVKP